MKAKGSYGELLDEGSHYLAERGITECRLDAWYLFSHVFSMERSQYFLQANETVPEEKRRQKEEFGRLLRLRGERIPLQQLLRSQDFMGLSFFVNEHVLIPRQDTETLVECVLEDEKQGKLCRREGQPLRILDLCTGSGCIGISLAEYLCNVQVTLSDISGEALAVAEENIRRLGKEAVCRTVRSDLFENLEGGFDVIVSNPPYIKSAEIETLEPEVRDHEPRLALDGSEDGLLLYRRIGARAPEYLAAGGRIYLEIGWDQGAAVSEILTENGFTDTEIIRDLPGLERVVTAGFRGRK